MQGRRGTSRLYTLAALSDWNLSLLFFLLVLFLELNFNWLFILHFLFGQLPVIVTGGSGKAGKTALSKRRESGCK